MVDENKKEFSDDDGIKFVDEFSRLQELKKATERKIEEIRKNIIGFALYKETNLIAGTDAQCSVKEYEKVILPADKTELLRLIKDKGIYEEVSSINYFKLNPKILKREIDDEIIALTTIGRDYRLVLKRIGFKV